MQKPCHARAEINERAEVSYVPDYAVNYRALLQRIEYLLLILILLGLKVKTNIRELEGALIRVVAYSKLIGKEVSVDLAKEVLKDMIIEGEKKITIDLIQKKVSEYFDIKLSDMRAKKRSRAIAYPRQVAMYLARQLTDFSLPEIGDQFGGRDHTTVIHACEKVENDFKNKPGLKITIDKLIQSIKN